jgi:hypothetical protein
VSASASEGVATAFVVLRGGVTVPLDALRLAWALEDRGATFAVEGDDLVIDGPLGFLTEDNRVAIRRWRLHLIAVATYHAPEVVE